MSYMWQTTNQRKRIMLMERERRLRRGRPRLKLEAVRAELRPLGHAPGGTMEARVALTDIGRKGMGLFSAVPLTTGQEIELTLEHPRRFYVRARIVSCTSCDAYTHVIRPRQDSRSFRVVVEFIFDSAVELESVERYYDEIRQEHLYGAPLDAYAA